MARTAPFHGVNRGSIPLGATREKRSPEDSEFFGGENYMRGGDGRYECFKTPRTATLLGFCKKVLSL